jgi:transcriptional regulator with XRE-family HTH domain
MSSTAAREAICSAVASIMKEERIKRGLSMTTVAARAGLSQQMISYVERGMRNPTLDTLLRVADVLNVSLDDIIHRAKLMAATRPDDRSQT